MKTYKNVFVPGFNFTGSITIDHDEQTAITGKKLIWDHTNEYGVERIFCANTVLERAISIELYHSFESAHLVFQNGYTEKTDYNRWREYTFAQKLLALDWLIKTG